MLEMKGLFGVIPSNPLCYARGPMQEMLTRGPALTAAACLGPCRGFVWKVVRDVHCKVIRLSGLNSMLHLCYYRCEENDRGVEWLKVVVHYYFFTSCLISFLHHYIPFLTLYIGFPFVFVLLLFFRMQIWSSDFNSSLTTHRQEILCDNKGLQVLAFCLLASLFCVRMLLVLCSDTRVFPSDSSLPPPAVGHWHLPSVPSSYLIHSYLFFTSQSLGSSLRKPFFTSLLTILYTFA